MSYKCWSCSATSSMGYIISLSTK